MDESIIDKNIFFIIIILYMDEGWIRMKKVNKSDNVLTVREMAVLKLMAMGYTNPEIAREMTVSLSTIKAHVSKIYEKLSASNRVEAILTAIKTNLVNI